MGMQRPLGQAKKLTGHLSFLLSRKKQKNIYTPLSPQEKQEGLEKGTRYMFWSCTKLVDFWSEIFNTICVACSLDIDAHPLSALFGVMFIVPLLKGPGLEKCYKM